jgi:hypothetical protein
MPTVHATDPIGRANSKWYHLPRRDTRRLGDFRELSEQPRLALGLAGFAILRPCWLLYCLSVVCHRLVLFFLLLLVQQELSDGGNTVPAVSSEHGTVDGGVPVAALRGCRGWYSPGWGSDRLRWLTSGSSAKPALLMPAPSTCGDSPIQREAMLPRSTKVQSHDPTPYDSPMSDHSMKRVAINSVASDLRDQADRDYITARQVYVLGFADQFMWQAQQCLEKYLKSAILYNWRLPDEGGTLPGPLGGRKRQSDGRTAYGHDLPRLLVDLIGIQPWQPDIPVSTQDYIKHFHRMGFNRYSDQHVYRFGDELSKLDESVWHVRRWCAYHMLTKMSNMPPTLTLDRWIEVQRESVMALRPGDRQHVGGKLESILEERRGRGSWTKWQARATLIRWNQWFFTKRRSPYLPPRMGSSSVPVWGRDWASKPDIAKLLVDIGVAPRP